jgi:ribonuclease J
MRICIHRGTKEIGGTCVELTADNGKILWIDLGTPLDEKNPNIDYIQNKVDALLISHPHQDHFGLMEKMGTEIPIYIGQLSLDLINATKIFRGKPQLNGNFKIIKAWESFTIADTFHVKPYLTDHSSPEAFAYLIEADGKRVFYSGDFRASGRKGKVYENLIENPPDNVDLLLMEGTMVERSNHLYPSEESIQEAIFTIIKDQKNVTFVISSAQNIDRFVSVFKACRDAHKHLIIDAYSAWILEMVRKISPGTPAIEWKEIKVYNDPKQLEKIKDISFEDFRDRIEKKSIGNTVFDNPSDFVYFVRYLNEKLIDRLRSKGIINIIYSQWEGYLGEEHKTKSSDLINRLKVDNGISFHPIHTSGHATITDLIKEAKAINSKMIVPIHTKLPEKFKTEFEKEGFSNIQLWDDGKEYKL